jgi:hypothetical protein
VMRTIILALAGLSVIVALASCGKQAELQRPGPLWGAKAKADYAAQKRAQADNASNAAAANKVIGPQSPALHPYTDPAPAYQVPIPGERTYPSGTPDSTGSGPQ